MKLGFTGTRNGMTKAQKDSFSALVTELLPDEFHHGDCVGADDESAEIVSQSTECLARDQIHCHPPTDDTHRAFNTRSRVVYVEKTHFARNRDIVDMTDALIATPWVRPLPPSGGTVYTINYAKKKGKRVLIIWPDGTVEV